MQSLRLSGSFALPGAIQRGIVVPTVFVEEASSLFHLCGMPSAFDRRFLIEFHA
jgi:hypothetical protein